ncbi:MAG: tRNA (adenosine(37)-N6)-threonylcarbamoyltransferase complex ATPase subunit type 1 TsaE [candidate division Zixibacteria bacterium]|nr:tRNA (adenosine(37)-N6)-threonylcarbamoyltransferase complex ATPase subunit type 1 TsaE [candidate division Zixibacteria bacterium]
MQALSIVSHGERQTFELGKKLAASFVAGDLVVLEGPLGAGKTVFVRGLVAGRGLSDTTVNSPSFTMVNEYPGEKPLYHFDLYRISDPRELFEIGFDDYLARDGVVVIEWGTKADYLLPERYYLVEIRIVSETEREINISLVQR